MQLSYLVISDSAVLSTSLTLLSFDHYYGVNLLVLQFEQVWVISLNPNLCLRWTGYMWYKHISTYNVVQESDTTLPFT